MNSGYISIRDIDTSFDFSTDCDYWNGFWERPFGSTRIDPDIASPTLRHYHQALWSRQLPNGEVLDLHFGTKDDYLRYGDMRFGSDSIAQSLRHRRNSAVLNQLVETGKYKEIIENFIHRAYTIGGMLIFPKHPISINRQRGTSQFIIDRFDLTLECIRRYYEGITDANNNPLGWVLNNDKTFFDMFVDFKGYCDFFFLQDAVTEDYTSVILRAHTELFEPNPYPKTLEAYLEYIQKELEFVEKRNKRIDNFIRESCCLQGQLM